MAVLAQILKTAETFAWDQNARIKRGWKYTGLYTADRGNV